jgi:cysteine desulfurase
MGSEIYFDNNATTCLAPEAFEAMRPYLTDLYGNPSSIHTFGSQVARQIEKARESVAALLGASDTVEVIFTSCGTEGDNAAIRGVLEANPDKRHIVTTQVEHPAVMGLCQHLEKRGYAVTWLRVDRDGLLDLEELKNSLREDTALVSVMYANNETGVIFPIEEIGEIAKSRGVFVHVDAVQAAGKVPLNIKNSPVDLLTISGHKFHGPKGVGALYVKRGITFRPLLIGGHQERRRRAGTENVPGIVGMGKAAELAAASLEEETRRVGTLRDLLEKNLLACCSDAVANGARAKRVPNTLNISFGRVDGESILVLLDERGICASTGSACTAGSTEPSHVLRSMGVPAELIQGTVRFSLSRYNTEEEVRLVSDEMPRTVERLRGLSALGRAAAQGGEQRVPARSLLH